MRAAPERIMPGAVFVPTDEEERQHFVSLDAARLLTSDEKTLYESGVQTEFPPSLFQPSNSDWQRSG